MNKIALLLIPLCIALGFTSCDTNEEIVGSGNIISEFRTLDPFEDVVITGVVVTQITYGESQSIEVRADDNIIDLLTTEIKQGSLYVELEGEHFSHITVEVDIIIPVLKSLTNSGVTTTTIRDFENLDILTIRNTGVENLNLSGSANKIILENTGTGSIEGFDFEVDTCQIQQTGVGDCRITVNELLTGSLTGVGNIYYKGNPQIDVTITGVGNVIDSN
jgi:hypothetical protein